jgi:hypothetical protein
MPIRRAAELGVAEYMNQITVQIDKRKNSISVVEQVADLSELLDLFGPTSSGVAGQGTSHTIPHSLIHAGESPRLAGEKPEHVEALAQANGRFPPILVHRQSMRVIDGMHRLRATRLRGERNVEVQFFDGDENEAFAAAVHANIAHGLPLTLADRQAAANRIIRWQPHRSDRWVAEVTGLAPGTVGAIRRRAARPETEGTARVGRDGRVRPLNPSDGRRKAQEEIRSNPNASLRDIARSAGISPATAKSVRDQLRSGDELVPGNRQASRQGRAAATHNRMARARDDDSSSARSKSSDIASSLVKLGKDPSLRYSESGRALLRLLEFQSRLPDSVAALMEEVPPHCGYLVADIARKCASDWRALAAILEGRPHTITWAEH